jgi:hypothetical protein
VSIKINGGRDTRDIIDARLWERSEGFCDINDSDRFPVFTGNISCSNYPREFKSVGITKYDGKQDSWQWICCYSTTIEVSGGSNTTKVIYLPMVLEFVALTWLESLKPDSIDSWEDLKKVFIENF